MDPILVFLEKAWTRFGVTHPEHQQAFLALCGSPEPLPISRLMFAAQLDRARLNVSLAALEALMLVEFREVGMAKNYALTELGVKFAKDVIHTEVAG